MVTVQDTIFLPKWCVILVNHLIFQDNCLRGTISRHLHKLTLGGNIIISYYLHKMSIAAL